jgi:heme-degrading monooxygenase HmoA
MIYIFHRFKMPNVPEEALARSWHQCTSATRQMTPGLLGATLLRSAKDANEYVSVARWESVAAWREFWSAGPPEPQGDPSRNEFLVEVATFEPDAKATARPRRRAKPRDRSREKSEAPRSR